ncbi:MAG: DUF2079 domain-containing protein [Deltaproteobacteria bacterium]|nr:DUF2079 domain-containing protein [Deltaproteobacteria bacterium]
MQDPSPEPPAPPHRPYGLSEGAMWALTSAAIAAVAVTFTRRQLTALAAHDAHWAQDLAFFHQIVHNAAAGRAWASSLLLEPTGFFQMVHFHPMLVGVVALYGVFPTVSLLAALNVGMTVATAWPLAGLGRAATGSAVFGLSAALSWLMWAPVESAAGADFRPMELVMPGTALVIWGAYEGKPRIWALGALLCISAREEMAYLLTAYGIVLTLSPLPGGRRYGLLTLCSGLSFFVFLLIFKDNFFFHFDPTKPPVGDPPPPELRDARLTWLSQALLGSYTLAPVGLTPFLCSFAPLAYLWTDASREWQLPTGPYVHLRAPFLALWACAGVLGAAWAARRWPRTLPLLCSCLILGNALTLPDDRAALTRRAEAQRETLGDPAHAARLALLARVKPEDRVGTDYTLIAALSGREVIWQVRHLYLEDSEPPHWEAEWPVTLDRLDTLVVPPDDPVLRHVDDAWTMEAEGGGYTLWRRTRPPLGGFPTPLP